MNKNIKIGLFGIGLDTYWSQFEGLQDKLKSYQEQIKKKDRKFYCRSCGCRNG